MTPRKTWPEHVEHKRMDIIALALDVMFLVSEVQTANRDGKRVDVARLSKAIFDKANRIQQLSQEAKRA